MEGDEVRVLVIDDDADASATLAMLLEMDGYLVRTASDGQQALDIARAFSPLCVLIDIQMPGLGGHETCRQLRQTYGDALILIAVTGAGISDDRISDRFSQFDHYLRKPVDPQALRTLLPPVDDPRPV